MKSSLKDNIEFTGKNYKKEIVKIVLINLILLGLLFVFLYFLKQLIFTIFIGIGILVINYFMFSSYGSLKAKIIAAREDEFIVVLSYFEMFINNNKNVYQAFKMTVKYCSLWMQDKIENLIKQIDDDKSVQPFVNFANNFTSPVVGNVMLSIYQMVDQGEEKGQMSEFTLLFEQLSKSHQEDLIDKKRNSLDSMNSFPLIGAGGITILVTFCIVSLLGEMINVI